MSPPPIFGVLGLKVVDFFSNMNSFLVFRSSLGPYATKFTWGYWKSVPRAIWYMSKVKRCPFFLLGRCESIFEQERVIFSNGLILIFVDIQWNDLRYFEGCRLKNEKSATKLVICELILSIYNDAVSWLLVVKIR